MPEKYFLEFYVLFDVSEEISLSKIESLFKAKKISEEEFPYRRSTPEYIKYAVAPLSIKLGSRKIESNNKQFEFVFRAKIFDFGVISIKATTEIETTLFELNKITSELSASDVLEKKANSLLEDLVKNIQPAIVSMRSPTSFFEKYLIVNGKVNPDFDSKKFLDENHKDIARLLSLETKILSEQQETANLENKMSYYDHDLAIVDFNASFVLDATEPKDILDVLELARIQLLELRFFDSLLDRELEKIYDDLEKLKQQDYAKILKKTSELKISVNELVEKTENAMKLFGETYLVRLYNLALKEFNVPQWKHSVEEKIATVDDIYNKINDRQQDNRSARFEIILVILEILFILLWIYELFFKHVIQ